MALSHSTSTYEPSDEEVEVASDSEEEEEEEYVAEEEKQKKNKKKKMTVWSEKDEITILEGLIKLQKLSSSLGKKCNIRHFYSVIKDSLVADVSREQLTDKVKRLKTKFMQNKKNKLADPNLSIDYDSHSRRVFELSKRIWDECVSDPESEEKKKMMKKKKKVMVDNEIDDFADDDDNKMMKKKRKTINESESENRGLEVTAESESLNVFHQSFHTHCEEKGLEVKWLKKEEREKLQNLWKAFSEVECDLKIMEIKRDRLRNALDETVYRHLKRCYNSSPALFSFDY